MVRGTGDINLRKGQSYQVAAFFADKQSAFGAVSLKYDYTDTLEPKRILIQRPDSPAEGGVDVKLSQS